MNSHTAGHWWALACILAACGGVALFVNTGRGLERICAWLDRRTVKASDYSWLLHEREFIAVANGRPAPPPISRKAALKALDAELSDIPVDDIIAAYIAAKEK